MSMTIKKLLCAAVITMDVLCAYTNFKLRDVAGAMRFIGLAILVYVSYALTEVR